MTTPPNDPSTPPQPGSPDPTPAPAGTPPTPSGPPGQFPTSSEPGQFTPPAPPGQFPPPAGQYPPAPGQPGAFPTPGQPAQYPPTPGQPGQYPPPSGQYPTPESGQPGQYPPPSGQYPPTPGQPGQIPPAPGQQYPGQPAYGAAPQAGWGAGQPPQQAQPLADYGQPGSTPTAPKSPSKARNVILRVVGIIAVIVVGLAVKLGAHGAFHHQTKNEKSYSTAESADVGDCAKITGGSYKPEVTKLDCSDHDATMQVALRLDTSNGKCPTEDYISIYKSFGSGKDFTICYTLNAKEGDCFKSDSGDNYIRMACGPGAKFKVSRIIKGTADGNECGDRTDARNALIYPKPSPITICRVSPE